MRYGAYNITTRAFTEGRMKGLWQIKVDGNDLPGARVLKMGRSYLPVYDGTKPASVTANFGAYASRMEAVRAVVEGLTNDPLGWDSDTGRHRAL